MVEWSDQVKDGMLEIRELIQHYHYRHAYTWAEAANLVLGDILERFRNTNDALVYANTFENLYGCMTVYSANAIRAAVWCYKHNPKIVNWTATDQPDSY